MNSTYCVLWSKYVITRSPSSSKRLLTWLRYSGTFQTKYLNRSVTKRFLILLKKLEYCFLYKFLFKSRILKAKY